MVQHSCSVCAAWRARTEQKDPTTTPHVSDVSVSSVSVSVSKTEIPESENNGQLVVVRLSPFPKTQIKQMATSQEQAAPAPPAAEAPRPSSSHGPSRTLTSISLAIAFLAAGFSLYQPTALQPSSAGASNRISEITSSYPSRSGAYPYNIITTDESINEIGQRPINNSVPNVHFTLAENGNGTMPGLSLESVNFKDIDDIIGKHCCKIANMPQERCLPNSGARLISDTGVRLMSFNDLENGQRVYCVPQATHFVWPLHFVGKEFYPKNVIGPIPGQPIKLKQLSNQPRVFSVSNFVSPEEIEEIMRTNMHRLTPSEVGFGGWQDDTRTSTTSWDEKSKASKLIQKRTFEILGMDYFSELADTLQVLRYTSDGNGSGQWYKPHTDWFDESSYDGHDPLINNGSNRFATMFLYLSDVEEGGATVFPHSTTHEGYNGEKIVHDGTIDTPSYINTAEARKACTKESTALKSYPVQGNAVLFYNQGPTGELDAYSLHGGCPPLKGTKMSANVWVWNRQSPPKSSAKDVDPKRGATPVEGQIQIEFTNTRKSQVDLYWDAMTPRSGFEDLQAFTNAFKTNKDRFHSQGVLKAGRALELNSFESHVFVAIDSETKECVWVGAVSPDNKEFLLK